MFANPYEPIQCALILGKELIHNDSGPQLCHTSAESEGLRQHRRLGTTELAAYSVLPLPNSPTLAYSNNNGKATNTKTPIIPF